MSDKGRFLLRVPANRNGYSFLKRFKEYANKKRKPTRPKIAEKSAARAKKIQRRKGGGQVSPGEAYVASSYDQSN